MVKEGNEAFMAGQYENALNLWTGAVEGGT
jgi:hypothetical protein